MTELLDLQPPDTVSAAPKVFLETFGCQMNFMDSELVRGRLLENRFRFCSDRDQADVICFNTCAVRDHAEARVLLIGEEFLGHLAQMELETVKRVVVVGAGGEHAAYEDWIADREPTDPALGCEPDATCYQLYTSGTTGLPKGVELSHRNLMTAMDVGAKEWSIDGDSVVLVAMPLFHIAGSGWGIAGFCQGAEGVIVRDPEGGHDQPGRIHACARAEDDALRIDE